MSDDLVKRIKDRGDWLVDAVATATQNRQFLRGEPECDAVACDAIRMNGEKAMEIVAKPLADRIEALTAENASLKHRVAELEALLYAVTAYHNGKPSNPPAYRASQNQIGRNGMSELNLHGTIDAAVWAKEFCKRWPTAFCQIEGKEGVESGAKFESTMIDWFANAIMTGHDFAQNAIAGHVSALTAEIGKLRAELKSILDHKVATQARHDARVEKLEADLAKAVAELEWHAEQPEAHPFMALRAKATLAELKGEK